jgi:hypothetical protein
MSVQKAVMALSEKFAVLAEKCGPTPDPIIVKRRWRFLGIFPTSRIDSELWVAGDGDWWRVMLSNARRLQVIGADFRKVAGHCPAECDVIAWKWRGDKWELASPSEAPGIRERIETSIELAYSHCRTGTINV